MRGNRSGRSQSQSGQSQSRSRISKHGKEVDRFYHSALWKRCRESYYQYRLGICEKCGRSFPSSKMIVHHKVHITADNVDSPLATSFDNLELLCIECHNHEHYASERTLRLEQRTSFDEFGNVIIRETER